MCEFLLSAYDQGVWAQCKDLFTQGSWATFFQSMIRPRGPKRNVMLQNSINIIFFRPWETVNPYIWPPIHKIN